MILHWFYSGLAAFLSISSCWFLVAFMILALLWLTVANLLLFLICFKYVESHAEKFSGEVAEEYICIKNK